MAQLSSSDTPTTAMVNEGDAASAAWPPTRQSRSKLGAWWHRRKGRMQRRCVPTTSRRILLIAFVLFAPFYIWQIVLSSSRLQVAIDDHSHGGAWTDAAADRPHAANERPPLLHVARQKQGPAQQQHNVTYVGMGRWQNRGLNLVHCLRSMLLVATDNDDSDNDGSSSTAANYYGETIDFTIRKLQLQFLRPPPNSMIATASMLRNDGHAGNRSNNTADADDRLGIYNYTRHVRGALYPSIIPLPVAHRQHVSQHLHQDSHGDPSRSDDDDYYQDDGYTSFVTESLPSIDAWAELDQVLLSLQMEKNDEKSLSKRKSLLKIMADFQRGGDDKIYFHESTAAKFLAMELLLVPQRQQRSSLGGYFVSKKSPVEAASVDGPSIVALQQPHGRNATSRTDKYHGPVPPGQVVGFELRVPQKGGGIANDGTNGNDDTDTNTMTDDGIPVVKLAFYKQRIQMSGGRGGDAVVILRPAPGSTVACIVVGQQTSAGESRARLGGGFVGGMTPFYECAPSKENNARDKGVDSSRRALPVVGLLFGSDFAGGCKAASRVLDVMWGSFETEEGWHKDDILWSQEMQNVFSSVSTAMRKPLYLASYEPSPGMDGASTIRCSSIASFWKVGKDKKKGSGDGFDGSLQFWQSYRDAAASSVGLGWPLSQCLVRLPTKLYPEARVANQTLAGSLLSFRDSKLSRVDNACYGSTGSLCNIHLDAATYCELTCEHSGSYTVSRGITIVGGEHQSPSCFDFERKLETPIARRNSTLSWLSQELADPVRWYSPLAGKTSEWQRDGEEPHSVTIVFTSDVHGRFFRECGPSYCYPGASHIGSVIDTVRLAVSRSGRVDTALLVDAGDATFGSQYNESLVGMTMNRLGYEVMALGNHEFDIGLRLDEFVDLVNFPIVSTNVRGVPFASSFVRVRLKGGATLCILGVSTNEHNPLAGRNVTFSAESHVIEMVRDLRSRQGCNHTALLSHAGIEADKRFAKELSAGLDVIVGGHSHVLMGANGADHIPESSEFGAVSAMSFPFQRVGEPAIAHVGSNGRYLGLLHLSWVKSRLKSTHGTLIPLDEQHGVFPDFELDMWQKRLTCLDGSRDKVDATDIEIDGSLARNDLCGQTCRTQECLMGNLATNAMLSCATYGPCSKYANETMRTVALLESGTLRSCIGTKREDFSEILPWQNHLVLLTMKGATVRRMLQHGVKDMREGQGGAFLQASGLKYVFRGSQLENVFMSKPNIRRPNHSRRRIRFPMDNRYVSELCAIPGVHSRDMAIKDDEIFLVVVTDWLASGGDGYGDIISASPFITTDTTLREAILEHARSFPSVRAEDRAESADTKLTTSTKHGLSGFVGGALSFLSTFPLYTLFVQRSASRTISCSFRSLFAGAMLGMLATAISQCIYFVVYGSPKLAEYPIFARSTVAAITNSVATNPLWVLATRKQVKEGSTSVLSVAKDVYDESGLFGFFSGTAMNLVMCVFPVVQQVSLEMMVSSLSLKDRNHIAAAAAVSSWIATLVTFPIQQIRIRMQSGKGNVFRGRYFDGAIFKILHSCSTTFVLYLVKQQSEMILCILEG